MLHERMHCLDYSMKQDRITQREAFDWNITPEMKGWGEKIRREYYMEKLKIKKFSLENIWYHIEFDLKKYYVRV